MERYAHSVGDEPSRFRVIEDREAQFPIIGVRSKQGAKIASRYSQQVRGEYIHQPAKVQPGCHAVRDFEKQAKSVAFASQLLFVPVPLNGDLSDVAGVLNQFPGAAAGAAPLG